MVDASDGTRTAGPRYLKHHRQARPREIVATLRKQEIDAGPTKVSMIRAQSKVKRAFREAGEANASHSSNLEVKLT